MSELNLCVLGAGVVGLNTALQLQEEFRNASITIIADKFYKDTTSFVAAGLFLPSAGFSGPSVEITRDCVNYSFHYYNHLFTNYGGPEVGIMESSGYFFSSVSPEFVKNRYVEKLLPIYRAATEDELKLCGGHKYGSYFSTFIVENRLYLPWATQKFLGSNGKILTRKIDELSELAGKYDIVVNCTGLGARFLCRDENVVPIRGQILKVRAPWLNKIYLEDWDTYIIPGFEGVTLGGTRQYGSFNLNWNKYDEMDIIERCEKFIPALRGCPVVAKRVGLRPFRTTLRLEPEILNVYESKIKIVHNYGHSGYGVTISPGTARLAVKLVREMLSKSSKL